MKKKLHSFKLIVLGVFLLYSNYSNAQQFLNQVFIASGGAFSNPSDFVTVSVFDPSSSVQVDFDTIYTQAVQKMLVHQGVLSITALDSIVFYSLENLQRIGAIDVSGPNFMQVVGNKLFLSIQYPETNGFLRVYNLETMDWEYTIDQVSGETADILLMNDLLFVAVPGDYLSTTGSIAVIDPASDSFIHEENFGEAGAGIYSLFAYDSKIVAVCKSAWGTNSGSIIIYNPEENTFDNYLFDHAFGKGIAVDQDVLYLMIDNGIGSIDLTTMQVSNSAIVADPGSSNFIYFADVAFDILGQNFYATISDYFSFGEGLIFALDGTQIGDFFAGISPEAIALDYRIPSKLDVRVPGEFNVYPNPVSHELNIEAFGQFGQMKAILIDIQGQIVLEQNLAASQKIKLNHLRPGIYQLLLVTNDVFVTSKKIVVTH